MARKISYAVLIGALLVSAMQGTSAADFGDLLSQSINQMAEGIRRQVQEQLKPLQLLGPMIERNVKNELQKVWENVSRDANGNIISETYTTDNGVIINSVNGMGQMIVSRNTPNGNLYIVDQNDGKTRDHFEKMTYSNGTVRTYHWKLDLSTPGATPVIVKDEN